MDFLGIFEGFSMDFEGFLMDSKLNARDAEPIKFR